MGNITATPAPEKKTGSDLSFQSDIGAIKDVADPKTTQADSKVSPVAANIWETHLIEVYGRTLSLSHPRIEPGTVTMDYGLNPAIIPLQEGVAMSPGWDFGQISSYEEGKDTKGVIFNATGGVLAFEPPNLKGVEATAQLAVATIVAEEASDAVKQNPISTDKDKTEISASLAEPIVIEPMKDFKMELNNGTYRKGVGDASPKLTFFRTTRTYKDQPVAADFMTESDETGLHLADSSASVPLAEEVLSVLPEKEKFYVQEKSHVRLLRMRAGNWLASVQCAGVGTYVHLPGIVTDSAGAFAISAKIAVLNLSPGEYPIVKTRIRSA